VIKATQLLNNVTDRAAILPIVTVLFIFLLAVQGITLFFQIKAEKQAYHRLVDYVTTSHANQNSINLNAQKNLLLSLVALHQKELTQLATDADTLTMLDLSINESFANYRGMYVLDSKKQLVRSTIPQLFKGEQQAIESIVNDANWLPHMGMYLGGEYFENSGVIYFVIGFSPDLLNKASHFLVISRTVQDYAQDLLSQSYDGFDLWLTRGQRVVIGNGQFIKEDKTIQSMLGDRQLLFSRPMQGAPWTVHAIEDPEFWQKKQLSMALPHAIFILVYWFLVVSSIQLLQYLKRKNDNQLEQFSDQINQAEQALSCIEEIIITTDCQGKINYTNPSAQLWLGSKRMGNVIGKPIRQVFPYLGLPWNEPQSEILYENSALHYGDVLVDIDSQLITFNISCYFTNTNQQGKSAIWVLRDVTRQAQDRELLNQSRSRYQALYDGCGVGMWHVDVSLVRSWLGKVTVPSLREYLQKNPDAFSELRASFSLIDINESALAMYGGQDKAKLITMIKEIFDQQNHDLIVQMAQNIFDGEQSFSHEVKFKNSKGELTHYLVKVTLDQVGQDEALLSFIDINDRIQAEQALRESEQFWSNVIHTLPDTVYVNDLFQKQTRYSSRHIGELVGFTQDEVQDITHWRQLIHPEDVDKSEQAITRLKSMKSGEVNETTIRLKHKNGSWRIIRFRDCIFTQSHNGEPRYYVGIARDITEEEDAKIQLSYSERRYRLLANGISDIVFTLNRQLDLTYISASINKMLGHDSDQAMREGLSLFLITDSFNKLYQALKRDLQLALSISSFKDQVRTMDLDAQTINGVPVILEMQSSILRNEAGQIEGILATCRDVTQRRFIEQEARTASEVFENSSEAIIVTTSAGAISRVNKAFTHLTGFDGKQVIGISPKKFMANNMSGKKIQQISDALLIDGYWQGEINYVTKKGESRPSWTGITALKDEMGQMQSHIIISSDITHRKQSEARIEHLAYFDPLTGLPNRAQMHEALDKLMQAEEQRLALLFIDLDRFKPINDTMGHPVGDQVLKEVAIRLASAVRDTDLVSRIGGDEFTVIMSALPEEQYGLNVIIDVSERILQKMTQPFFIEDRQLYLSASVGVALYPENALSGTDLLRNADTAMYHAKAKGKNNFQFYAEEMNEKALERLELENNLHLALQRDEFELTFQPQWDIKHNKICGVETLLRWHRPGYGMVGPDKFIPIIEETGLIVPIGEWVLKAACEQIMEWQEAGYVIPKLSVNLSARQFKDAQMLDRICRIVDETGVDPELIELELTESILMDDIERTLAVLNETRKMGFGLSIDDFGTGYSSLSYLKQFPVNQLKIDKSFIQNLPYNQEDGQITRTIVAMANNLGLGVIAEGVENESQRQFLKTIGCYQVQGYMYSHPIPADIFAQDFLETESYLEQEPQ